jgi:hypothetical protein
MAVAGFSLLLWFGLMYLLVFADRNIGLFWIILIPDVMSIFLYLSAAITMSAELGVNGCGKDDDIFGSRQRCSEAQATTILLWLGMTIWKNYLMVEFVTCVLCTFTSANLGFRFI